jgi:hypothetical protein
MKIPTVGNTRDASPTRSLCGSHHRSFVAESSLSRRGFVTDKTCGRHQRAFTLVDFALGQCCNMDLRSPPSFCTETVSRGGVSKQYACHSTASPSSQPDTDDDHIERDGDDGRDLVINDDV